MYHSVAQYYLLQAPVKCVNFLSAEFPTPKTELVQKFQVLYLGMMPVARPIGWYNTHTHTLNGFKLGNK